MGQKTIQEIADVLRSRHKASNENNKEPLVLFLGARAGSFFGNQKLYEKFKGLTTNTFDKLDEQQKFQACYEILGAMRTELDRYGVLSQSLGEKHDYRPEDHYVAELFKANYFDAIISTTIDLRLEDALRRERVDEQRHYELLICGKSPTTKIVQNKKGIVLKIFGDLESNIYKTAGDEFFIEEVDKELREFIEDLMNSQLLMVAYDSEWDGPLNKALFKKGGSVIYVSETEPAGDSFISRVLDARESSCLIGETGTYKHFFRDLYFELFQENVFAIEAIQKVSRQMFQVQEEWNEKSDLLQKLITKLEEEISALREAIKKQ